MAGVLLELGVQSENVLFQIRKRKWKCKKLKPIASERLSVPRFCKDGSGIFGDRFAIGECHVSKIYAFVSNCIREVICPSFFQVWLGVFCS